VSALRRLLSDESGATTVEYAVVGGTLALMALAALAAIANQCAARLAVTSGKLTALGTSPP
jgi:Flp pilus assembly pilin Flp